MSKANNNENNNDNIFEPGLTLQTEGQLGLPSQRHQQQQQWFQIQTINNQEEGEECDHPSSINQKSQNQNHENPVKSKDLLLASLPTTVGNVGFAENSQEEDKSEGENSSGIHKKSRIQISRNEVEEILRVPLKKSKYRGRLVGNEKKNNSDSENNRKQQNKKFKAGHQECLQENKPNKIDNINNVIEVDEVQEKGKKNDPKEEQPQQPSLQVENTSQQAQYQQQLPVNKKQNKKKNQQNQQLRDNGNKEIQQYQDMKEELDEEQQFLQLIQGEEDYEEQCQKDQKVNLEDKANNSNNKMNIQNNNNFSSSNGQNENQENNGVAQGGAVMTEEGLAASSDVINQYQENISQLLNNANQSIQIPPNNEYYAEPQLSQQFHWQQFHQQQQQQIQLRNQLMQQNNQRLIEMIQRTQAQVLNLGDQPQGRTCSFKLLQPGNQQQQQQQFMQQSSMISGSIQQDPMQYNQMVYPLNNNNNSNNNSNDNNILPNQTNNININMNPLQNFNQAILNMNNQQQQLPRTPPSRVQSQQSMQQQSQFAPPQMNGNQQLRQQQQQQQFGNNSAFNPPSLSYSNIFSFQQQFSQNVRQQLIQQRSSLLQGRQQINQNLAAQPIPASNLILPGNLSLEYTGDGQVRQANFVPPQAWRSIIQGITQQTSQDQGPQNPILANQPASQPQQQTRQRPTTNQLPQEMRNKYYIYQNNTYQDSHNPDEPFMKITVMKTNQDNANNSNVHTVTARGMVKSKKNTISEDIIIGRQETTKIVDNATQESVEIKPTDIVLPSSDIAISRIHCKIIYKDGFRIPKKVTNEFILFLYAIKKNKIVIPDVALRILWSMVRPKFAFYIVDLGSAQGTFIKIRYEKSQVIEKGQVFLIGAETQFQILDVVHSHPEVPQKQVQIEGNGDQEDQDFFEFLMREKKNSTHIHGLSDEEKQKLDALVNMSENEEQDIMTQFIDSRKSFRPYVKLKVSSSTVSFHLFILNQQAIEQGFKIGRSQECTIQININTISRKQSRIFYANGKWQLKDGDMVRESANGTWISLNDSREKNKTRNESELKEIEDGSEIKISESILKIEICNNQPKKIKPRYSFSLDQIEIEQDNNQNCDEIEDSHHQANQHNEEDQDESNPQGRQDLDVTS